VAGLLSYVLALVYHDRVGSERDRLRHLIAASVRSDDRRREVHTMGRTIAEELRDEGRAEEAVRSRQQTLLRLLRLRFRKVPKAVEGIILATTDVAQLDGWVDQVLTAQTLNDMSIGAP
jgi:hypothetical protein